MTNSSRETKFSSANAKRETSFFPVQLTTSRIGILTPLIYTLAICVTIHGNRSTENSTKEIASVLS